MIKFIKGHSKFIGRDKNGKEHFVGELVCDTAAELAGMTEVDGVVLEFGSMALAAKEGKLCIFASDGSWYCDGEEVTADV